MNCTMETKTSVQGRSSLFPFTSCAHCHQLVGKKSMARLSEIHKSSGHERLRFERLANSKIQLQPGFNQKDFGAQNGVSLTFIDVVFGTTRY